MGEAPSRTGELLGIAAAHCLPVYRQRPMVLSHGRGSRLWDLDGRDYVDFAGGIAVCALGHADPGLVQALAEQGGKLWHVSNVFHSEPPLRLADALVRASRFASRAFFCNSGAEANEAAIKLARRHAANRGRPAEKRVIVTAHGSFHGRTLATVTATAQPKYQEGFEPLPGGFRHVDFNDLPALEAAMAGDDVCAVLLEPVQGEGGVMPADAGYLRGVRALCDAHGALLMLDEIQCGMGRTGPLFAHWADEVVPDVVTLAKALGAGFPIGAMLVGGDAADALQFGSHGTTFGGNPLASAVALAALERIDGEAIRENVRRQSRVLHEALVDIGRATGLFGEVRGRGLMLGAVLPPEHAARAGEILDAAAAHGVLLLQAGPQVLRFVPALNIDDAEVADGLERLRTALRSLG